MPKYRLQWITSQLAVGHAPLSYDDLEFIKKSGINAIINLCAEFCDLPEIEKEYGFDVKYLPIKDEDVPSLEEMEETLEWLDEAIYLGKKVLVHCKHGIGRTGTFVTAYLIRKGFHPKIAEKKIKKTSAYPSSYYQWQLLRKLGKKEKSLTIREPSLEIKNVVNLAPFFNEYDLLLETILKEYPSIPQCGKDNTNCCQFNFQVYLIEAAYITHHINKELPLDKRKEIIDKAIKNLKNMKENNTQHDCPLLDSNKCQLFEFRPVRCVIYNMSLPEVKLVQINEIIERLDMNLFLALTGKFAPHQPLKFTLNEVISGKYVQRYFEYMTRFNLA